MSILAKRLLGAAGLVGAGGGGGSAPTLATSGYTWVAIWKVSTTLYGALIGDGS